MKSGGQSSEGPDMKRYLVLLDESVVSFCVVAVLVAVLGVAVSYVLPKRYQAQSSVSIEENVVNELVKGIAITPSLEAKLRILKVSILSRKMLLRVIKDLDMDLGLQGEGLERLIETTRSNVEITHEERKGLFYIRYANSSPEKARDFVNALTRRYIEESTSSKREESYEATRFLSDQISVFQKRIDSAQQAIDAYKSEKGMILSLNENILREEIKETEHRLEETRIRKNERLAQLNILEKGSGGGRLAEKEASYKTLLRTYTDQHPDVVRAREELEALRSGGSGTERRKSSMEYQRLKVELESLNEIEQVQQALIEKDKRLLQELPAVQTELQALQQARKNETLIYEQLVSRYGQSEVSKQMELQDKAVSFRIIDPAILPLRPSSPNRPLIMLGSMVVGIIVAAGGIILSDQFFRRVRSLEDLTSRGFLVLGALPRIATAADARVARRRRTAIALALLAMLCIAGLAGVEYSGFEGLDMLFARVRNILSTWL